MTPIPYNMVQAWLDAELVRMLPPTAAAAAVAYRAGCCVHRDSALQQQQQQQQQQEWWCTLADAVCVCVHALSVVHRQSSS
jgi:hypothetical protein